MLGRQRRRLMQVLRAPIERQLGVITHVATDESAVALTFDDGPNPDSTPRLLDALARTVPARRFSWSAKWRSGIRRWSMPWRAAGMPSATIRGTIRRFRRYRRRSE